jgi:hypothetical protein
MTTARTAGHPANHSPRAKAHVPAQESGLQRWQVGIDRAGAAWDVYDCDLRSVVSEYNRHLVDTNGYFPLDWKIVKAMLWVETGGGSPDWRRKPMQIGNHDDPGLASLLLGDEGGQLIIPPSMQPGLSMGSATSDPVQNIRAGVGYLLMRHAIYANQSVLSADTRIHEVTAAPGDSLDRIAKAQGSTAEVMKRLNPSVHTVHAGDLLRYQRATVKRVITGWRPLSADGIARRYNRGDSRYAEKMGYASAAINMRVEAACR